MPTRGYFMDSHSGSCFCGAVKFAVTGKPELMCLCHCESCRHWSAAPVTAATLWKPEALKFSAGAEKIGSFRRTPNTYRKWCVECGGHLYTELALYGLVDVFDALIPQFAFKPAFHINYGEAVLPIKDGLSKFKDLPKEIGGSGDILPE